MAAVQQCLVIISDSGFTANSKTTEVDGSIFRLYLNVLFFKKRRSHSLDF